jgi:pimeloyl-ACP methyl ester carboxylesterase
MSESIRLETHILDIVNLFLWEDIDDAVLVGHSYAGWVISGAVERLEGRVASIVFLDAFLPQDGQCGFDLLNDEQKAAFREAQARGDVSRPGPTSAALKIQRPEDATWLDSKISRQPIGVSVDPIKLTGAREKVRSKVYVRTPLFPQPRFDTALERCTADPTWTTVIMDGCGHDPMIDVPERVCKLLESLP